MSQILSFRCLCKLGLLGLALCHGVLLHAQGILMFPTESGFSGNIALGASYMSVASNFATHKSKLGEDDLESLDSKPDTQEQVLGFPRFELAYTFADAGWQLHLGNAALDFYRFDRANVAGVRKNFGKVGVIGVGYVFSALPDYVWEDPYRLSSEREETRRGSAGGRLTWDFIGGTPINFRYTQRNIRVGDEASGSDLDLDFEAQQDLRRDGAQRVAELNMFIPLGSGKVLLPAIDYIRNDREGKAVSNQSIQVRVVYKMPLSTRWTMLAEVLAGGLTAQEENPIFLDTEKNKRFGAGLTFKYDQLFGLEAMSLVVRAASYREDSNIDFYSGDISTFGAFIGYKF
jgi:hypothetical protein